MGGGGGGGGDADTIVVVKSPEIYLVRVPGNDRTCGHTNHSVLLPDDTIVTN